MAHGKTMKVAKNTRKTFARHCEECDVCSYANNYASVFCAEGQMLWNQEQLGYALQEQASRRSRRLLHA